MADHHQGTVTGGGEVKRGHRIMSVASTQAQATFCATLFDEFARAGMEHVVVCPGSRSTPLALAAAESRSQVHVRLDERSAGFYALGIARASNKPVPIVVTSGTAVAELTPAVVEAALDRVPLIVLSADRPIELQHRGSPQTIHQASLFHAHATYSLDLQSPSGLEPSEWRHLAARLLVEAQGLRGVRGVSHLNLGLTEPLTQGPGELPDGRHDGGPWLRSVQPNTPHASLQDLAARRVVVLGDSVTDEALLERFLRSSLVPVLADPRSGARRILANSLICYADAIVRSSAARTAIRPDQIIVVGAPAASKELGLWIQDCANLGTQVLTLGPDGPERFPYPMSVEHRMVSSFDAAIAMLAGDPTPGEAAFLQAWCDAEARVTNSFEQFFEVNGWSEPGVVRMVHSHARKGSRLHVSSSMPIRDLEFFGGPGLAVVTSNRGANGIDGVVSTALGIAAIGDETTCVIGDLAFLHDVSALVDGVEEGNTVRIVVLDNHGGGIFSFLSQRQDLDEERFEQLFGTPPSVDLAQVARGFGLKTYEASTPEELQRMLSQEISGLEIVICRLGDRDHNLAIHNQLHALAASVLD